jgi:hypothetical protein
MRMSKSITMGMMRSMFEVSSPVLEQAAKPAARANPPAVRTAAALRLFLKPARETIHHWAVFTRRKVVGAKRTSLGGQTSSGGAWPKKRS